MNLGHIFADHLNHLCVDDEDDHRILVTKCGLRVGYTPPKNRQSSPFGDHITCFECMTLDENVDPDERERHERNARENAALKRAYDQGFAAAQAATVYRCNVPMCGESGVCAECRKRGAR